MCKRRACVGTQSTKSNRVKDRSAVSIGDLFVCHKNKPRSQELKSSVSRRINRVIGQLGGIKTMVEDDRYCGDVLIQLAAVESAVKAISREVMQDHLRSCVVDRVQQGDTDVIDEVMDLFKKFM